MNEKELEDKVIEILDKVTEVFAEIGEHLAKLCTKSETAALLAILSFFPPISVLIALSLIAYLYKRKFV